MQDRPAFAELSATMKRVWDDHEELGRRDIHLLGSQYDELEGKWIQFDVVTTRPSEAEQFLREHYSDLIRINVVSDSLTEDVATPWQTYRADAAGRTVYVRYETSGYHRGARAEVSETSDAVTITVIETRWVGAYGPVLAHEEQEVRLARPLGARRVVDGSRATNSRS